VPLPSLAYLAQNNGLVLVHAEGLSNFIANSCGGGGGGDGEDLVGLLASMSVLPSRGQRPLSMDEWEAISLYAAVVFRRK
jgi:hypothetical protein